MSLTESLLFECKLLSSSFIEFAHLVLNASRSAGLPPVIGWCSTGPDEIHHADMGGVLEEIKRMNTDDPQHITLLFSQSSTLDLDFDVRSSIGSVHAIMYPESSIGLAVLNLLSALVSFLRELLNVGNVNQGNVQRLDREGFPLPSVPLVHPMAYAVVATNATVQEAYDDPEAFWSSGWDGIEDYSGKKLLLRALDVATRTELLIAVGEQQRALARIAKAGRTVYEGTKPSDPEELAIYELSPGRLRLTTYLEDEKTLVLTCTVEPSEHIDGWEIDRLNEILRAGGLDDGRVVKAVRTIFPDEASALREKRPLLDVGVNVEYLDELGDLVTLDE